MRRRAPTAKERAAAIAVLDGAMTQQEAAAEFEVGSPYARGAIKRAVAEERGRREAAASLAPAPLSASQQARLDAAIARKERELDVAFEQRVRDEARRRMAAMYERCREEARHYEAVIKARKGVLKLEEFNKLLFVAHPDRAAAVTDTDRVEAVRILMGKKLALVAEKENPTTFPPLPATLEEAWRRRKA